MIRSIRICIAFCSLVFMLNSAALGQNIDSLVVRISQVNNQTGPWNFHSQITDSFSTGIKKSTVIRLWNSFQWKNSVWDSYTYNGFGNLTNHTKQTWDTAGWKNFTRKLNSYNAGNLILTEVNQSWSGSAWINNNQSLHSYNSLLTDTVILLQTWINSSWRNTTRNDRTFDVNGFLIIETFSNYDTISSGWSMVYRYLHSPDVNGQDQERITQMRNDTTWNDNYKEKYVYDQNGVRIGVDRYRMIIPGEWEHEDNLSFNFDSLGRYIGFTNDCQGACGYSSGTLNYDSLSNLHSTYNYSESMGGIISESKANYYYLSFPNSSLLYVFLPEDFERCSLNPKPVGAFTLGGSGLLRYNWTPSAGLTSDSILNPLSVADSSINYLLEVTDSLGHTVTDNITITVLTSPKPSVFIQSIDTTSLCNSAMLATDSTSWLYCRWYKNDTLQINPYGYSAAHFPIVENGVYVVTAQNLEGCSNSDTIVFSDFDHPSAAVTITTHCNQLIANCQQASNFQWFNGGILIFGAVNDTLDAPMSGDYKVMIQDQSGCINFSNQQVFHPMKLNLNVGSTCSGSCTGWISANTNFGVSPYQYEWSNGDSTFMSDSLCQGNYSVSVTDSRGCVVSKMDSITFYNDFPAYNIVASSVTDSNSCNGAAFVNFPSPAYYPYFTYLWSDSSTKYMNTVCSGWNYVKITSNFHSCVEIDSFFVNINPTNNNCDVSLTVNNPHCHSVCDGYIEAIPVGMSPFNYVWLPNGERNISLSNLCPGNYSMFMIDANGCIDSTSNNLIAQDTMLAAFTVLSGSPSQPCSTLVNANIINGFAPYSFDWCGVSTQNPAYLCPGNCTLTVEDITGCISQFTYDVPDSVEACSYSSIVVPVSANGVCDGSVALTILGTAPFTFTWTTGSTDSALTNLCEGTYFFAATDSNGCIVTDSVVIGVDGTVSIPENDIDKLLIYPNPGRNELHIILPENVRNENYILSVYDSRGKLLFESNSIAKIPFAKWPSGLYEFLLRYEKGMIKSRWVKG